MAFIVGSVLIGAGASIVGGAMQSRAAGKAADAQGDASAQEIAFSRESRDLARKDQEPYRKAGVTALDALMSMTGLGGGSSRSSGGAVFPNQNPGQPSTRFQEDLWQPPRMGGGSKRSSGYRLHARYAGGPMRGRFDNAGPIKGPQGRSGPQYMTNEMGPENVYSGGAINRNQNPAVIDGQTGYVQPNENPGGVEGGYNFQTDPGYQFRFNEGQRAIEAGAAARGGLISGGTAKKAIRYGQGMASQEYGNVYNRIASIAGIGQVSAGASGGYAMQAGMQMGNAANNAGYARGSGYLAQGNAWANAGNQIAQLPWGKAFGRNESGTSTRLLGID